MNKLIKKGSCFIRLLLNTMSQQQKALIKTITSTQMKAIVHIVYNVLQGNRDIPVQSKNKMLKHKRFIRRFIAKRLTHKNRINLFLKYSTFILLLGVVGWCDGTW